MKRETLDGLLIDQALGELPDDVAELLDAYTATDAAAAGRREALRTTLDLTRSLWSRAEPSRPAVVPAFPARAIARALSQRSLLKWMRPAALAACLGLAFAAGWRMKPREPAVAGAPVIRVAAVDTPWRVDRGFWSYQERRAAEPVRQEELVRWSSPLRWPRIGGAS